MDPNAAPGRSAHDKARRLAAGRARRGVEAESKYERAWRTGGDGERLTGEALNLAARAHDTIAVMHDLVAPGEKKNIDHLVIGPGGVYVIDSKNWGGPLWIGRTTIGQRNRTRHKAMTGIREQVARVREVLTAAGHEPVPVKGLLCMVNREAALGEEIQHIEDIGVGHVNPVVHHTLSEGPLDPVARHRLYLRLSAAFVVHGGAEVPATADALTLPPPAAPSAGKRRRTLAGARIVLALMLLSVAMVLAIVVFALLGTTARTVEQSLRYMTATELREARPEHRALARREAGGRVRGPRVETTSTSFVLTFRRCRRCRVEVHVSRLPEAVGRVAPTVRSTDCRA